MSATLTTQVRHKCYIYDTSAARVKNFDFDNNTSENIFSHSYSSYMENEKLQGEEQFNSMTSFWKSFVPMPKCV